jgi:hypothetical protein
MMADDDLVLVANSEDYKIPYTRVWFVPAASAQHGRVYFGYDNWSPQGGMTVDLYFNKEYAIIYEQIMETFVQKKIVKLENNRFTALVNP